MNQDHPATMFRVIRPRVTWDQLVVPPETMDQLHQVVAQVRQRPQAEAARDLAARRSGGPGITVLFAGEPGTGRATAAEIIAGVLKVDLYRIDLAAMVSKYISETEKNLRRVFGAAEAGGDVLLFDEADALFGRRTEFKDSHDRYANLEVAHLLESMESHPGLTILTTNRRQALDPAFLRRLLLVVEFPHPGPAERAQLWQRAFPPEAPIEELDCSGLAQYPLTGGDIRRIALNAALLAARAGTRITAPHVVESLRTELRKLDRPVNEADLSASG